MTRIAKGKQTGELWDRVKLENGIVGYVFQNYLAIVTEPQVEQISGKFAYSSGNQGAV